MKRIYRCPVWCAILLLVNAGSANETLHPDGKLAVDAAETPMRTVIDTTLRHAAKQYDLMLAQLPAGSRLPRTFEKDRLVTVPPQDWTSGFFPGSLWYLFEATRDPRWKNAAAHYTGLLEGEQFNRSGHDVGFMLYCSYGNGLRLTGDARYRTVLLNGAASLSTRFHPEVGAIRSWDHAGWSYPVIIDNMMNLELLLWAGREGKVPRFREIAVAHADLTLRNHFRPDGSTFHVVDYDPVTGRVLQRKTHQGSADSSAWARGQAWALYGFTLMYRETREPRYLVQAEKTAGFLIHHPRLPADKIPFWDFDAPSIPDAPRDAAAAAIMCSALFELSGYADPAAGKGYADFAERQLRSLASPTYLADIGTNGGFLLKHVTGHYPNKTEVDVPLIYADYYLLEALLRAQVRLGPAP